MLSVGLSVHSCTGRPILGRHAHLIGNAANCGSRPSAPDAWGIGTVAAQDPLLHGVDGGMIRAWVAVAGVRRRRICSPWHRLESLRRY
jgi:hypothetical protein